MRKDGMDADFSRIIKKSRELNFRRITGMPGPEFKLLQVIGCLESDLPADGKVHVSDLVREMEMPAPLISRALKALEEKVLIEREADRNDRRSTIVSLTPTGRKKMEAVCERSGRLMEAVRQKFGEEKLAELKLLLEEMVDVTAAAIAEIEEAEE